MNDSYIYLKIGSYSPETSDSPEVISREFYEQGYIFKDEEAYVKDFDKVCYIPELSDDKYTHKDFLKICNNDEMEAREIFDTVNWQSPQSLYDEWYDYDRG